MDHLARAIDAYLEACRERLQPLVDRQPWTELAVNPGPHFRAIISEVERSPQFTVAAKALDRHLGDERLDEEFAVEGPSHARHHWHLSAFLWNASVYDSLIRGETPDSAGLADAITHEAGREDTRYKHAAFLENFSLESRASVEAFAIRVLSGQEAKEAFAGRCELDAREHWPIVHEAVRDAWFAVVERPARPLVDHLTFRGAIGLHDFEGSPFRNVNLGLNLFKAAPGPVVIRQTFHWNNSLFHRHVDDYPRQSDDLYPSSWGGPSDEPPPMRLYRLDDSDVAQLPAFWQRFEELYGAHRRFAPAYLHRAIDRFLRACKAKRTDWELRQLLYVMALEALYSGEDQDGVRPTNRFGKELGSLNTVSRCCANLVAPRQGDIGLLKEWLAGDKRKSTTGIYQQRSRVAHGSTFEQEEFFAQPQDPEEHKDAIRICGILGIDTGSVSEGPDIGFAVLHNLVRVSLLHFIGRVAQNLGSGECARIVAELSASKGRDKVERNRRMELREDLEDLHLADKKQFLQELHDCFQVEKDRQRLRDVSGGLAGETV